MWELAKRTTLCRPGDTAGGVQDDKEVGEMRFEGARVETSRVV